jgi:phosphoesterase RecJ-like protein
MTNLAAVASVLARSRYPLITGHIVPDGDSLGSTLALGLALEQVGKRVTMFSPDPVPSTYGFLPGAERLVADAVALTGTHDLVVVVDCARPERIAPALRPLVERVPVLVLDHHPENHAFGVWRHIDPSAAATGEIVFDLLEVLGLPPTKETGTCLYTAILTDTGCFRFSNTTPATHRRVARIMEAGVPASLISSLLYEEKPLTHLLVLKVALETLSLSSCGRMAWMTLSREVLRELAARDEHLDGIIDYARLVRGVELALLFRELPEGRVKVGLRSKRCVDVNRIAALFGGGGHARAAGCLVEGDLRVVREQVLAAAMEALEAACVRA